MPQVTPTESPLSKCELVPEISKVVQWFLQLMEFAEHFFHPLSQISYKQKLNILTHHFYFFQISNAYFQA